MRQMPGSQPAQDGDAAPTVGHDKSHDRKRCFVAIVAALGGIIALIWLFWRLAPKEGDPADRNTLTKLAIAVPLALAITAMLRFALLLPSDIRQTNRHQKNQANSGQKTRALIRWSIQEIRRIAQRFKRRHINPAFIIAWSLWRRAHQAAAQEAHIKCSSRPNMCRIFDGKVGGGTVAKEMRIDREHRALPASD
jgi:hypothetical protein